MKSLKKKQLDDGKIRDIGISRYILDQMEECAGGNAIDGNRGDVDISKGLSNVATEGFSNSEKQYEKGYSGLKSKPKRNCLGLVNKSKQKRCRRQERKGIC